MALSTLLHIKHPILFAPLHFSISQIHPRKPLIPTSIRTLKSHNKMLPHRPNAISTQGVLSEAMRLIQSAPPPWQSALFSNLSIFLVGSPILVSGLSLSGIFAAFLLGTLTWRAFGPSRFLLVAFYFIIVSWKRKGLNLYLLNWFMFWVVFVGFWWFVLLGFFYGLCNWIPFVLVIQALHFMPLLSFLVICIIFMHVYVAWAFFLILFNLDFFHLILVHFLCKN